MAFPTVTAQNPIADSSTGGAATGGSSGAASHSVVLPASVDAGDLLMVFGRTAGAGAVAVTSGGWTINQASDSSGDVAFWGYRDTLADGTEDGTSITVTHGTLKTCAYTVAISGAADPATQPPEASTVAVGTSTTPNPTACTPTGGAKDYLWIWFGGWEGENNNVLSKSAPATYTDAPDVSTGTGGAVNTNCQLKTATRTNNAASEDPGSVTLSVADDWAAWVIAVHPAAPNSGSAGGSVSWAGSATGDAPTLPLQDDVFPGETIIWGGTSGHPYTTVGGTGTTATDDTSDFAIGDRSIRINTNGTGQNSFVRVLNGPSMDFTNRAPRIWIKVDSNTRFLDGTLWLGSGGGLGSAYQWAIDPDDAIAPYYASNEWVAMTLPWSAAAVVGTPNRAALTDVNFQIFDNSGGPLAVWWGGLSSVPDTTDLYPNGVVSFTFDDGFASHNAEAATYMQGKGFRGTAYIINDVIGTGAYMSTSQMVALQNTYDWEVGLHSATAADHNAVGGLTSLTTPQLQANIDANRDFLVTNGIDEPTGFAYPQGLFNVRTTQDITSLVTRARTTKGVHLETVPPGARLKMYTRAVDASTSAATITALIDQAKSNREWLILTFHDIVSSGATGNEVNQSTFRAIVDYAETAGVDVLPVREVGVLPPAEGSASGSIAWAGSSTGSTTRQGAASGSIAWAGSAQGLVARQGTASGDIAWTGVAQGAAEHRGSASGTAGWAGTATGAAPGITPNEGSASGGVGWAGTAQGAATHQGAASGGAAWTGSAQGSRGSTGTGVGTVDFSGTAQGLRAASGTASGSVAWSGAATGGRSSRGDASGSTHWTGVASGARRSIGTAVGTALWSGLAAGARAARGTAVGATDWLGIATGGEALPAPELSDPGATMTPNAAAATLVANPAGTTLVANQATATLTANTAGATLAPNTVTAALVPVTTSATWRPGVSQLKQNDTAPPAEATLTDGGTPIDLTGATVKFAMVIKSAPTTKVFADAAVVAPATDGKVRYEWQPGDTDTPGTYQVEWQVTWPDTTVQTFPPASYLSLTITKELDVSG